MKLRIGTRWVLGVLCLLGLAGYASGQRVSGYSPAQTTVSYPSATSDLPVVISLEGTTVPPALPSYSMRAYWDTQVAANRIPVTGTPGATTATVTVSPSFRTAGLHKVIFCVVINLGPGPVESCTDPATSATFTINPDPVITTASPLPPASVSTPYSLQLNATGGTGSRTWSVAAGSSLPPGLALNPTSGAITGTPTQAGIFNFTAVVTDSLGVQGTRLLAISVSSALTIVTPATLPTAQVGVAYSTTIAAAGGAPPYSFSTNSSVLPPGMVLNAVTGVLSGTPSVVGNYSFLVTVIDSQENSAERTFFINVSETVSAPTIITASPLPEATLGTFYTQSLVVSGGKSPYSFSILSGVLPPGLMLDTSSGVISGTPSQSGNFTFVVGVIDSLEGSSNKSFVLRVSQAISITTSELPVGTVGEPYPGTEIVVSGGAAPYLFTSLGNFPPGLSLNSETGVIGGTPTQSGVFAFSVLVFDSNERSARRDFTISIGAGLRFRTTSPLPSGQVGESYDRTLEVEGGRAPYQFQLISGSLPAGITLSATGRLQGTPNAPFDGSFTVRATDSGQPMLSVERQFRLQIAVALIISTQSLPPAIVGQTYSQIIAVSGGTTPYTFEVSNGTLPPGILLARTNGTLSGTPTALGTFPFTVRVADTEGRSGTQALTLEVRPAPVTGATVTLQTGTPSPNTQQQVDVNLGTPRSDTVSGALVLEFAPSVTPPVDDPAAQFVSGGRRVSFQIPAGQTSARFGETEQALFQTGTVAGTITIRAQLLVSGADATPTPPPTSTVVLPPLAPTLTNLSATRTSSGLNVVVRGYSTPRNMTSATVNFTARAGSNITSGLSFTVNLTPAFTTWYTSNSSNAFGSLFQLTLPVTISGDPTEITGLSIALSNSVGASNSLSATF